MPLSITPPTPETKGKEKNQLCAPPPATQLTPGASFLLDLIRLISALVVAWGHLTLPDFSSGLTNRMQSAGAAVIVFFVLSGFVIRYVTCRTPASFPTYIIDRASRIYSVLLPAVILTCLVALSFGYLPLHSAADVRSLGLRVTQTLFFTNWSWHQQVTLPPNGALWSISFECLFYLLYGAFFYLRGRTRIFCLLLAVAWAGPEILTFFPIWLAGCLLYQAYIRLRTIHLGRLAKSTAALGLLVSLSALALRHHFADLHQWLAATFHFLQTDTTANNSWLHLFFPRVGHGAPISLNAYPEAAIYCVTFLALLLVADHIPLKDQSSIRKWGTRLADATFPLYLIHLPLFCIAVRLVGHPMASVPAAAALLAAVLALSVAVAPAMNRFKSQLRLRSHHFIDRSQPAGRAV